MSTAQTVLEYIQALKWPVVVSAVAFTFRRAIGQFLKRIAESDEGSVNVAGVADLKWRNQVNEVARQAEIFEEQATTAPAPDAVGEGDIEPDSPEAIDIVMKYSGLRDDAWEAIDRSVITDPTGAVIGAWVRVEDALFAVGRDRGLNVGKARSSVPQILSNLNIPAELLTLIQDLRTLRNEAAHSQATIDSDVALTYVQSAKRVVVILVTVFPSSVF